MKLKGHQLRIILLLLSGFTLVAWGLHSEQSSVQSTKEIVRFPLANGESKRFEFLVPKSARYVANGLFDPCDHSPDKEPSSELQAALAITILRVADSARIGHKGSSLFPCKAHYVADLEKERRYEIHVTNASPIHVWIDLKLAAHETKDVNLWAGIHQTVGLALALLGGILWWRTPNARKP
jgi:hypothetical protein